MISTWGIFWICLFSAAVLEVLIKRLIPPKYPEIDEDTLEKLRELLNLFSDRSNNPSNTKKPKSKIRLSQ